MCDAAVQCGDTQNVGICVKWLQPLSMFYLLQIAGHIRYVVASTPTTKDLVDALYEYVHFVVYSGNDIAPQFTRLCAAVIYHLRWRLMEAIDECYGCVGTHTINSTTMPQLDNYLQTIWIYRIRLSTTLWTTEEDERLVLLLQRLLVPGITFNIYDFKESYVKAIKLWFGEQRTHPAAKKEWDNFERYFMRFKLGPRDIGSALYRHVRKSQKLISLQGQILTEPLFYHADFAYEMACEIFFRQRRHIHPVIRKSLNADNHSIEYTELDNEGRLFISKNKYYGFSLVGGE